jgi:pheromone shutdown protein TraB
MGKNEGVNHGGHRVKERLTLALSIVVYLLCNLRLTATPQGSLIATGWWLLYTAPFYAGISLLIIVFLQAMAGGAKLPWERRLRVFLAVGMIAGVVTSVWENMGFNVWKRLGITLASYSPPFPL